MSRKSKVFYVKSGDSLWGPIPWSHLRHWLGFKWLSADTILRESPNSEDFFAKDEPKLWTKSGKKYDPQDISAGMASGKLPISPALIKYLNIDLGFPGNLTGINYYNADRLRKDLELVFPDVNRPLFDDPDWPKCWSGGSPAAEARIVASRRAEVPSERQIAVLKFFNKYRVDISAGEASDVIQILLSEPTNNMAWEAKKKTLFSSEPASEAQLFRLEFASNKLGKKFERGLSKYEAIKLCDEWFGSNPDLEDDYREYKDATALSDMLEDQRISKAEEELEFRNPIASLSVKKSIPVKSQGGGCLGVIIVVFALGVMGVYLI